MPPYHTSYEAWKDWERKNPGLPKERAWEKQEAPQVELVSESIEKSGKQSNLSNG